MRSFPLVSSLLLALTGCNFGLTMETGLGGVDAPLDGGDTDAGSGPDAQSEADALPETAVELTGKLYGIPPASMNVTEPPGLNGIFDQVLDRPVLVYIEDETSSTLQLDVALAGTDGRQDPCEAVRRFPEGDWSENPVFDVGPGELTTSFGGHPATFRHLELSGVFDEYAFAWRDGTLDAQLDTRELAPALPGVDDLCGMVEALGGTCTACDDGEELCFELRIEGIIADMVDDDFEVEPDPDTCAG